MTEQERIALLVRICGNGRKFAEKVGTTSGSVSKLLSGRFHIDAFAVRIANAFPEVNCRWLLTGEGEPFAKEAENSEIKAELRALRVAVEEIGREMEIGLQFDAEIVFKVFLRVYCILWE